jgi:predicted nucleotidyltransferase
VTLDAGRTYFDVAALHDDLADLLGRSVDVLTDGAIHGRLAHIADEAIAL